MAQIQINLLSKELRDKEATIGEIVLRWVAIFAVLGVIGLGGLQFFELHTLAQDQATAKVDLDRTQKKAADVQKYKSLEESIKKTGDVIQKVKSSNPANYSIMALIQAKTPGGVTLKSETLKDGVADLRLEGTTMLEVEKLVNSLRAEKTFSEVETKTLSQEAGKPVQYSISFRYAKGGDGK